MKKIILFVPILFVAFFLFAGTMEPGKIKTVTINTYGMHCTGCEETVEAEIMKLKGIRTVNADHSKQTVTVEYETTKTSLGKIKNAIKAAGYKLEKSQN